MILIFSDDGIAKNGHPMVIGQAGGCTDFQGFIDEVSDVNNNNMHTSGITFLFTNYIVSLSAMAVFRKVNFAKLNANFSPFHCSLMV